MHPLLFLSLLEKPSFDVGMSFDLFWFQEKPYSLQSLLFFFSHCFLVFNDFSWKELEFDFVSLVILLKPSQGYVKESGIRANQAKKTNHKRVNRPKSHQKLIQVTVKSLTRACIEDFSILLLNSLLFNQVLFSIRLLMAMR